MPAKEYRTELRRDLHHGGWVAINYDPERLAGVAAQVKPLARKKRDDASCPFCPGQEKQTPQEITALRPTEKNPGRSAWLYRVIPARKPILGVEGTLDPEGEGMYDRMRGIGAQEVLIEHPRHDERLETFEPSHGSILLGVVQERIRDLERDFRLKFLHYRRVYDPNATGHLAHPHSQILAASIFPLRFLSELKCAQEYWRFKQRCLICDIQREDIKNEVRVIYADPKVLAVMPYASRIPFEIHLYPTRHSHSFAEANPEEIVALAKAIQTVWRGLIQLLPGWKIELTLDTSRGRIDEFFYWQTIREDYHWHLEMCPSPPVYPPAWTDFGGIPVCAVPPEKAAEALRNACRESE